MRIKKILLALLLVGLTAVPGVQIVEAQDPPEYGERDSDHDFTIGGTLQSGYQYRSFFIEGGFVYGLLSYFGSGTVHDQILVYTHPGGVHQANRKVILDDANSNPLGLHIEGTTAWVLDASDGVIYEYGLLSGNENPDARLSLSGLSAPNSLAESNGIWYTIETSGTDTLRAYNRSDGARRTDFEFSFASLNTSAIALEVVGGNLYVWDGSDNYAYVYRLSDGARQIDLEFAITNPTSSEQDIKNKSGLMYFMKSTQIGSTNVIAYVVGSPPDAPMSPTVSAGAGTMRVQWDEPDDNDETITGYEVQYKEDSASDWTDWGSTTGRDVTISGLDVGTTYNARVRAENANGFSPWSSSSSATPSSVPDVPTLSVVTQVGSFDLSWSEPMDGGSAITSYEINYRRTGQSSWTAQFITETGNPTDFASRTWTLSNPVLGSTYNFRVRAINLSGYSMWSSVASGIIALSQVGDVFPAPILQTIAFTFRCKLPDSSKSDCDEEDELIETMRPWPPLPGWQSQLSDGNKKTGVTLIQDLNVNQAVAQSPSPELLKWGRMIFRTPDIVAGQLGSEVRFEIVLVPPTPGDAYLEFQFTNARVKGVTDDTVNINGVFLGTGANPQTVSSAYTSWGQVGPAQAVVAVGTPTPVPVVQFISGEPPPASQDYVTLNAEAVFDAIGTMVPVDDVFYIEWRIDVRLYKSPQEEGQAAMFLAELPVNLTCIGCHLDEAYISTEPRNRVDAPIVGGVGSTVIDRDLYATDRVGSTTTGVPGVDEAENYRIPFVSLLATMFTQAGIQPKIFYSGLVFIIALVSMAFAVKLTTNLLFGWIAGGVVLGIAYTLTDGHIISVTIMGFYIATGIAITVLNSRQA